MLSVTTDSIDGREVESYRGVVSAEVIFGTNWVKDLVASFTDVLGGRSGTYEKVFEGARQAAMMQLEQRAEQKGANAVLAIRFNYQILGETNAMMMVAVSGTAVCLVKTAFEKAKDESQAADQEALYYVELWGQKKGPFSKLQLYEFHNIGRIDETTVVHIEGQDATKQLRDILKLSKG